MIETQNLSINRGQKRIVDAVEFQAKSGKFCVIAGPNGSGKSTLMAALAQDLPYQGKIILNGKDIKTINARQRALMRAVLPQSSALSFPFLVHEVLSLGVRAGNGAVDYLQGQDIIATALQKVGLENYGGRFYQQLSGGEQARVQLARVLCQVWHAFYQDEPCWLLLDEPVASLDIEHQLVVMKIARDFARAGGGVVAILHDLNLAASFADQLILMKNGKIFTQGHAGAVMTSANLAEVYNCDIKVNTPPKAGIPFILPQSLAENGEI